MKQQDEHDLARLQDAFSSEGWEEQGADCPDDETLWASATGELGPATDEGVLLHLAHCPRCASTWRLAREMVVPQDGEPEVVVPIENGARGGLWRRPALLAAAAALVIGIGVGSLLVHQAGRHVTPVYRQQTQELQITADPATRELHRETCRLRWSAGPEGTRYDLTVSGADLSILAVARGLTKPEYVLPPERIPASSGEILWRVTAHLPDGRRITSRTFTSRIGE